jgi:hypothetical protein
MEASEMGRIDHKIFQGPGLEEGMELFAFESDFVATLRCIPMAVRFKLDLACVKVSLRQWSRFTVTDRIDLLTWPCATADEIGAYRQRLVEMIKQRAGEVAKLIDLDPAPAWASALAPPQVLQEHAALLQADPITPGQWAALTPLRRFTLLKLTRDGHDNVNFVPALREFGLARPPRFGPRGFSAGPWQGHGRNAPGIVIQPPPAMPVT